MGLHSCPVKQTNTVDAALALYSAASEILLPLHMALADSDNDNVGCGVGDSVGLGVIVGVSVGRGVDVLVGVDVAVGPNNCPGAQVDKAKLKSRTNIMAVCCFVFISSPRYHGRTRRRFKGVAYLFDKVHPPDGLTRR